MIYIYECDKCKRTMEVRHFVNDVLTKHSDITEGHEGLIEPCNGNIKRIIQTSAVIFKGNGWTPKHFK